MTGGRSARVLDTAKYATFLPGISETFRPKNSPHFGDLEAFGMNWRLIGVISAMGVALGLVTLYVEFGQGVQIGISLAVAILFAVTLARFQPDRHFLHGFVAGLIYGTISSFLTGLMWETFLEHHPVTAERLEETASQVGDWIFQFGRYLSLFLAPLSGAVTGLILGLLAWIASKIIPPSNPPIPEGVEGEIPEEEAPPEAPPEVPPPPTP